jgi:hypothetical protein
MKKTLSLCLFSFILLSLVSSYGLCQSADEILVNMIKAGGGRKVLEKIKDTTVTGTAELVQFGMNAEITIYQKEPHKMRLDFSIMGTVITQAFDGETAWGVNIQTGATEEMGELEAEYFRRDAYGNAALLDPTKFGIKYSLKGKEKIKGKDYYLLEQAFANGYKALLYIDSETYLTYKVKAKGLGQTGLEVESETFLSDYKEVDGVILAHSMVVFQDGAEYMNFITTEVIFNSGLEDSLFKMDR